MTYYKYLISFLFLIFLVPSIVYSATSFNDDGDFSVQIDDSKFIVYNDNLEIQDSFNIKNNLDTKQLIKIPSISVNGWDIEINEEAFYLEASESKKINFVIEANEDFDYKFNIVSDNYVKISQGNSDYLGSYVIPVQLIGVNENVSFSYEVFVDKKEKLSISFNTVFYEERIMPLDRYQFSVIGENIEKDQLIKVKFTMNDEVTVFDEIFSVDEYVKVFEPKISNLAPGVYDSSVEVILQKEDNSYENWYFNNKIEVDVSESIDISTTEKNSFLYKIITYTFENNGNIDMLVEKDFDLTFIEKLFSQISLNEDDYEYDNSVLTITKTVKVGETEIGEVQVNYWILYLVGLIIIVLLIVYYRDMTSNPLEISNRVYHITKDENEGIKSLKVKVEFENVKEKEIDDLKIIFRMPNYLNIKDGTFTLVEPKQVLKSHKEFKLTWEFKRFEKGESRILGFSLVNNKGILGDIKLDDLEIIVKSHGNTKKYYKSFPLIRN